MKNESQSLLIKEWYRRVVITSQSHYNYAQKLSKKHFYLGVPAAIISAIVGTTVFSTLDYLAESLWLKIVLGLLSIISAVLVTLQTLFNFNERATTHISLGAKYGSIRRDLEVVLQKKEINPKKFDKIVKRLNAKQTKLSENAPHIPSQIWIKTAKRYESRFKIVFPFKDKFKAK